MPHTYTITQLTITNDLETLGNDCINFEVIVQQGGNYFETKISYYRLHKYLKQFHPAIAKYFDDVRNNIAGFGPKETKVWAMLQAEEFDIMPYLHDYIENNNNHLEPLNEAPKPLTDEERKALKEKVAELDELVAGMRESNLKGIAFQDMLMEKLTAYVLEYYPEIFESEPKYIKELEGVLIDNILKLAEDIDTLAYKATTDDEE